MNYLFSQIFKTTSCFTVAAACSMSAWADVTYSYGVSTSLLELAPGATGEVELYLIETTTGDSISRLVDEDGLNSAQVSVLLTGTAPSDPAILTDAIANESEFNDLFGPTIGISPTSVSIYEVLDIEELTGPTGTDLGGGVRSVLLGSVTITAGSVVGETTSFSVEDDGLFDDTVTLLGIDPIDPLIAATSFDVTVVPEPASLALLCLGAFPLIARRRRH